MAIINNTMSAITGSRIGAPKPLNRSMMVFLPRAMGAIR